MKRLTNEEKIKEYFIEKVLPESTTEYNISLKKHKDYPENGKVAYFIESEFTFSLPCCPDSLERERLENVFVFTKDHQGNIIECVMVRDPELEITKEYIRR